MAWHFLSCRVLCRMTSAAHISTTDFYSVNVTSYLNVN